MSKPSSYGGPNLDEARYVAQTVSEMKVKAEVKVKVKVKAKVKVEVRGLGGRHPG